MTPYALDADVATLLSGTAGEPVSSIDTTRRLFRVDCVTRSFDETALDLATLACAAELLGCGERLLADSVAYVGQRKQYGRTHRLVPGDQARARRRPDRPRLRAAPGARSSSHARRLARSRPPRSAPGTPPHLAARTALQVHGAIGYTAEFDLGLWINRVRALVGAWGDTSYHRQRIARELAGA